MTATLSGMIRVVNPEQPLKALAPMAVRLSCSVIPDRLAKPENALPPMPSVPAATVSVVPAGMVPLYR